MNDIADVLGLKMPVALSLLDAAGISYTVELLRSSLEIKADADGSGGTDFSSLPQDDLRVVRQIADPDGTQRVFVCRIPETQQEKQKREKK